MSVNKDEFIDFLEEFLEEDEAKELGVKLGESDEAPLIDSPSTANFYLKVMNRINEDIESINKICDEEIEKHNRRVNDFRENKTLSLYKQYLYYEKILKNYAEHELANSKKKSVSLPFGTLSLKKQPDKWEYDEEKVIQWMKKNKKENLINRKVSESIDKKALKSLADVDKQGNVAKLDGEEVEGITVIPQPDKFSIKIK